MKEERVEGGRGRGIQVENAVREEKLMCHDGRGYWDEHGNMKRWCGVFNRNQFM